MKDDGIPRYENPKFRDMSGGNAGQGPAFHGGKLIGGVLHYPEGAEVDRERAARAQAFVDYCYRPGNFPAPDEEMAAVYGKPYLERFEKLKQKKIIRRALDGVLHHIASFQTPNQ